MTVSFIGVGDPHFDGKLRKFIPDLNQIIIKEIYKAIHYAQRWGVRKIVLYGDIADTPDLSDEALCLLLRMFAGHADLKFYLITGNHDRSSNEQHSLLSLREMVRLELLNNVQIIDEPTVLFRKTGSPVKFLPWPHKDTEADCLNVIHIEAEGTVWDHGRATDSTFSTNHVCVAGHLHTRQKVRNTYFSGTMYQTNFGEKPKKYFHHVVWNNPEDYSVKCIRTIPEFELINHIVSTEDDVGAISSDPTKLYKVFVKKGLVLDANAFGHLPNVLRVNAFATEKQLTAMLNEDLELQDLSEGVVMSVDDSLKSWLTSAAIENDLRKRTWKKFLSIKRRASESADVNAS